MANETHNTEHEIKFVPGRQMQAKMTVSSKIKDVPRLIEQIRNIFGLAPIVLLTPIVLSV